MSEKRNFCDEMPVPAESRWESSSRPLFVKTVWIDGHHHVVLGNEDPASKRPKKSRSRVSSSCSINSTVSRTSGKENIHVQNFKISTVKLILAGIHAQSAKPNRVNCEFPPSYSFDEAITVDVSPNECIKVKNFNKDVEFSKKPPCSKLHKFRSSQKYSPEKQLNYDRDHHKNYGSAFINSYLKNETVFNEHNTLSERVLMWLDLATNSGNTHQRLNVPPQNDRFKRVSTAKAYTTKQKRIFREETLNDRRPSHLLTNDISLHPENSMQSGEICHQAEKLNVHDSVVKSGRSPRDGNEVFVVQNKQKRVEEMRLVSTAVKENTASADLQIKRTKGLKRPETAKRQLHIFLPNLPKKSSECDSLLTVSSKSSMLPKSK